VMDKSASGPGPIAAARRKGTSLAQPELVRAEPLEAGQMLPLLVRPAIDGVDLVKWAENNRAYLNEQLIRHGAILFRGFDVREVTRFEQLIAAVSGNLLDYSYRSTPRSAVGGRIYTSTEYPAHQTIPLHNEMSYTRTWPMKIWFLCVKAAEQGGETPLADSAFVFERVDPRIRQRFAEKGVLYVRNYGNGLDLTWQDVFQTNDKAEVETYCRKNNIEFRWIGDQGLRTGQRCQAVAKHEPTGKTVWFNQAHLFHVSSLDSKVRESLAAHFAEEDFPRNAFYGDGSPIEPEALANIRDAYHQAERVFPWREGDLVMVDNMLVAHGRRPYSGTRKIVVGMAESSTNSELTL